MNKYYINQLSSANIICYHLKKLGKEMISKTVGIITNCYQTLFNPAKPLTHTITHYVPPPSPEPAEIELAKHVIIDDYAKPE